MEAVIEPYQSSNLWVVSIYYDICYDNVVLLLHKVTV